MAAAGFAMVGGVWVWNGWWMTVIVLARFGMASFAMVSGGYVCGGFMMAGFAMVSGGWFIFALSNV